MPDDGSGRAAARGKLVRDVVTGQVGWTPAEPTKVPAGLPYVPLGRRGEWLFLLDPVGEFLAIRVPDLSRQTVLMQPFATAPGSLFRLYPKVEPDRKGGWKAIPGKYTATHAADHILRLCGLRGQFHPERQLRGRGAWIDHNPHKELKDQDRFVCNLGDALLIGDRRNEQPGALHGFVYPSGAPKLPIAGTKPPPSGAAWLEQELAAWPWQFPKLGPRLLTGWLALASLSGALPLQPIVSISGGDERGRGLLIEVCAALLGEWAINAGEVNPASIEDASGWDSLAVIMEGRPAAALAVPRVVRRRPLWAVDVLTPATKARMVLCRGETATVLQFRNVLDLVLTGPLLGSQFHKRALLSAAEERRAWIVGRPGERWRELTERALPKWLALIAVQEGLTDRAELLALLLAGASIAREEDPVEADFVALESELNAMMLAMRADTVEPERRMFEALFGTVMEPGDATVLMEVAAASGFGQGEAAEGELTQEPGYMRTEAEAIAHAKFDPIAARATRRIGALGLKVVGSTPGYRQLAVALTAPARARLLERTRIGAEMHAEGVTIANTLLIGVPGAQRGKKPVYFPGLGVARCVLLPLNFVLDRLIGGDPAAAAEAWEKGPET